MSEIPPIAFRWEGDSFSPYGRFAKVADQHYVIGEVYALVPHEDRRMASHRAYFAACSEAWKNLPEEMGDRFPTADHLRKYCLIKAGFRDERTLVASSKAEARRLAAFIKPVDEFAVVTVSESVVTVYTAKSQSMRAMGKDDFMRSKNSVLEILENLLGVEPGQLSYNAGKAA